jgi:3-phenylpropionate/cinnamic acid dioxygenase small subunit
MANPAIDIPNLLYAYANAIDDGRFDECAALFDRGHLQAFGTKVKGREAIAGLWRNGIRLYECGTPRTRHIVTNPIITLSADGRTATCHSQWMVLQAAPSFPLQVIGTGRYDDSFAMFDGAWHFTEKSYARIDLVGDWTAHTNQPLVESER